MKVRSHLVVPGMDRRSWRPSIVVAVTALALVIGSCGSDTRSPQVILSSPSESPGAPTAEVPAEVPAVADAVQCEAGMIGFDNPALHVTFCYPQGWGFGEYGQSAPPERVPRTEFIGLTLLSPEAFGTGTPPDAEEVSDALRRGVVDLRFSFAAANRQWEGPGDTGCVPDGQAPSASSREGATFCEERFDWGGVGKANDQWTHSATGEFVQLRFLFPLLTPPVSRGADGAFREFPGSRLFVQGWMTAMRYEQQHDLIWQILDSIEAY